ncbi:hypothetical protein B296_00029417 [Ensete ventricosum]|uniref:Uncharacterized protein n=1 Tax=Ensete ventricosum TaxID=4639 RepID=A0A426Y770_ENSVE|nr:hypothetical protein B296_00029417 [Ensete ventricosum]
MDDYAREMMDLKTLVTRTLEKKGVLAKIRVKSLPHLSLPHPFPAIMIDPLDGRGLALVAELRASVFEAIEEEDRVLENDDNVPPALLGSCNDRAKQLHTSPSGFEFSTK